MDVKKSTTITRPICGYYNGCKKTNNYHKTYASIAMVIKIPITITGPICGYYIFEMTLWIL